MAVISKRHAANAILHATVARRLAAERHRLQHLLQSNCYWTAVYTLTYHNFLPLVSHYQCLLLLLLHCVIV